MYDESMKEVMEVLHNKSELATDAPSGVEGVLRRFGTVLCRLAISCLPILGLCVLYLAKNPYPPLLIASLTKWIAVCQIVAAIVWLSTDVASMLYDITHLNSSTFERRKRELKHDFSNALDLCRFEITTLKAVDKWLSIKIERMKLRLGIFMGGSDKVAIFALANTGWSIWHNLSRGDWSWEKNIYLYCMAMLSGLAVGGMLLSLLVKKLTYQRDLLALAIHVKESADSVSAKELEGNLESKGMAVNAVNY